MTDPTPDQRPGPEYPIRLMSQVAEGEQWRYPGHEGDNGWQPAANRPAVSTLHRRDMWVEVRPVPAAPAEAEERFSFFHVDDVFGIRDGDVVPGPAVYERAVALLNLDESVREDGGIARAWQSERQDRELERDLFASRVKEVEAERDEARAEVERLTADLARANRKLAEPRNPAVVAVGWQGDAEAERLKAELRTAAEDGRYWHGQRNEMLERAEKAERELAEARANITTYRRHFVKMKAERDALAGSTDAPPDRCAYCGARTVECRSKRAEQGDPCCGGCTHEGPERDATGPTDTAAEPLFTNKPTAVMGGQVIFVPDTVVLDHEQEVDVWPHGARPAAPTVTAEMASHVNAMRNATDQERADALNRLLAEQGGEG